MEDSSDVIESPEYGSRLIRNSLDVVIDQATHVAISRYFTSIVLSIAFLATHVLQDSPMVIHVKIAFNICHYSVSFLNDVYQIILRINYYFSHTFILFLIQYNCRYNQSFVYLREKKKTVND